MSLEGCGDGSLCDAHSRPWPHEDGLRDHPTAKMASCLVRRNGCQFVKCEVNLHAVSTSSPFGNIFGGLGFA